MENDCRWVAPRGREIQAVVYSLIGDIVVWSFLCRQPEEEQNMEFIGGVRGILVELGGLYTTLQPPDLAYMHSMNRFPSMHCDALSCSFIWPQLRHRPIQRVYK